MSDFGLRVVGKVVGVVDGSSNIIKLTCISYRVQEVCSIVVTSPAK